MSDDPTDAAFVDGPHRQMVDQPGQVAVTPFATLGPSASVVAPTPAAPSSPAKIVDRVINAAEAFGLPVRFMREVRRVYSISGGSDTDNVHPYHNWMTFRAATLEQLASADFRDSEMRRSFPTVYHEMTHAWFLLNRNRPDLTKLREASIAHYAGSPLHIEGKPAATGDDPDRIFLEATAEYAGNRVAKYVEAWLHVEQLAHDPEVLPHLITELLTQLRAEYDREGTRRVFGYENQGGFLGLGSTQAWTTVPMPEDLRNFVEFQLLEGRIPDQFNQDDRLTRLADEAAARAGAGRTPF